MERTVVAAAGSREDAEARLRALPLRDLVTELAKMGSQLARKEVELARVEARADLRAEIKMAGGLGVAGICGLLAIELLLVSVAFALMEANVLPGWAASLILAAIVLAVGTAAGLWGWAKRVRTPLAATRTSVADGFRWAKEQVA